MDAIKTNAGRYYSLTGMKLSAHPIHKDKPVSLPVIPEGITVEDGSRHAPVRVLDGTPDETWPWQMEEMTAIHHRICAWSTWFFAPDWQDRGRVDGKAWPMLGTAFFHMGMACNSALACAYHEAWHLVEEHMNDTWIAIVQQSLDQGPQWPGEYGEYLNKPVEQRAYAFQEFAMAVHRGLPIDVGPTASAALQVFGKVYSGEVGKEITEMLAPKKKRFGIF